MAPVVTALREVPGLSVAVAVTGQHREILDQVNRAFGIVPDHDLDIARPGQTLTDITVRTLRGLEPLLAEGDFDAVIVQGDTTTSTIAGLAAFYAKVPVAHVEAGLRTDTRWNPYPEEVNRRLTARLAELHLAPTDRARDALLAEGIARGDIVVTGNTIIDALHAVVDNLPADFDEPALKPLSRQDQPVVLVTTHRRESWGAPMRATGRAVRRLADAYPDAAFVVPLHPNPLVREALTPSLADAPNVLLTEPLGYFDFCRALARSSLVLTDSGGAQEEAPSLGRPVLVLRDTTERPEGVDRGLALLVGTDEERIISAATDAMRAPLPPALPASRCTVAHMVTDAPRCAALLR